MLCCDSAVAPARCLRVIALGRGGTVNALLAYRSEDRTQGRTGHRQEGAGRDARRGYERKRAISARETAAWLSRPYGEPARLAG